MKKSIIISITIATIVFTAFSFTSKNKVKSKLSSSCQTKIDTNKKQVNFTYFNVNNNQELYFYVKGKYMHPLYKTKLKGLELVDQLFSNYPYNWINEYVSVEITTNTGGLELKGVSPDNRLSEKQIRIIESVEIGDNITLLVKHNVNNPATNQLEIRELDMVFTVIPEVESEFIGGHEKMISYLQNNSRKSTSNMYLWTDELQLKLFFTVNEKGTVVNVKLENSSGFKELDNLVIDLVNEMPKWNPAKNADGITVSQEFELNLGNMGC